MIRPSNISTPIVSSPDKQRSLSFDQWLAGAALALLFVALRIVGILRENELEDEDSTGILYVADIIRSFDIRAFIELDPGVLPAYPAIIAGFPLITGDLELAGRLVSFFSSVASSSASLRTYDNVIGPPDTALPSAVNRIFREHSRNH